jgi:hypothetical protein
MNSLIHRVGSYESIVETLRTALQNIPYNSLKKQMGGCEPEIEITFYVLAKYIYNQVRRWCKKE